MREVELNTIFNIVVEPQKNFVNINDKKVRQEIERMVRIFQITNEQKKIFNVLSMASINDFELLHSSN